MNEELPSMIPNYFVAAFYFVEIAAKEIGRLGGVQDILAALRAFPYNVEIVANCCLALWSLVVDG